MKPIEVFVYYDTEESYQLSQLGLESSIDLCEVEPHTFYSVNAISSMTENRRNYDVIHSNGDTFVTTLSYDALKLLLSGDN